MTSSIYEASVARVLERLHKSADENDPGVMERVAARNRDTGFINEQSVADLLDEAFIPVPPEVGRFVYLLARASGAKRIVEFGTSFGISAIYLACAARENGGGVITTELSARKASTATKNLAEAGVEQYVELRRGDALETLGHLHGEVDLLFLDGWKNLYLPVLQVVEPRLRPGALVVADDLDVLPEAHKPYLGYVRNPANGYTSVEIPLGDRLEVSLRVG
jgi:predicted O-methyltransferase YrrM